MYWSPSKTYWSGIRNCHHLTVIPLKSETVKARKYKYDKNCMVGMVSQKLWWKK